MDCELQGGPGSVRFGYGLGMERFKRFRFSVLAVPLQKGFFGVSVEFNRKGRFRFRFRFLENGSSGSGSAFGFGGKNGSHGSGFRFRFGSWATLELITQVLHYTTCSQMPARTAPFCFSGPLDYQEALKGDIWKWDFALKFALENGISLFISLLFLREFHRQGDF